jgi:hypothetical protein
VDEQLSTTAQKKQVLPAVPTVENFWLAFHGEAHQKSANLAEHKKKLDDCIAVICVTVVCEVSFDVRQEKFNLEWRLSDCEKLW